MVLTRSSRSLVAFVAAVLLLLCQTALAAQACAHTGAPAQTESAAAPCHGAGGESPAPEKQLPAPTACEAANALPDGAKMPVFALGDLPTMLVAYEQSAVPGTTARGPQTLDAVCHSPPLSILHCRLLN